MAERADLVIVGAGAAGLMAAIQGGRAAHQSRRPLRIVMLDGATKLGAKILVAGGGRCNVTHDVVTEDAFAGSSRKAIAKVLRQFDVPQTVALFRELGVHLKRETTGKLFPTTDRARTVLDALLNEVQRLGVEILHPARVTNIIRRDDAFLVTARQPGSEKAVAARRVLLATGGKALPKTGSDGFGYELVRQLGHTVTERVFPALVPLTLPAGHWLCELSGIATEVTLELRRASGKRMQVFDGALLLTHFGLSGPAVLDISRYVTDLQTDDPDAHLCVNWLPGQTIETVDAWLLEPHRVGIGRVISDRLPGRLARAICQHVGVDPAVNSGQLTRDARRMLSRALVELHLPVTGDRGFTHAEVTAGGVPLREIDLKRMASRCCPGLYLCGEICDVDGRIGGYNFQWAWASGTVAGRAAVEAELNSTADDAPDSARAV